MLAKHYIVFALIFFGFGVTSLLAESGWYWNNTISGSGVESVVDAFTASNGDVYIAGNFNSSSVTIGEFTLTNSGENDIFIAKFNAYGQCQWAFKVGGFANDTAAFIRSDANGNVYLGGNTETNPLSFGSLTANRIGFFVAKMGVNQNWLWVRQATNGSCVAVSGAIDSSGANVYLTGTFINSVTIGSSTLTPYGNTDVFVAKITSSGSWAWANKAGGSDQESVKKILVDGSGNAYIAGQSVSMQMYIGSTLFYTLYPAFQTTDMENPEMFWPWYFNFMYYAKINSSGNWVWGNGLQGSSEMGIYGDYFPTNDFTVNLKDVTLDSVGNLYTCYDSYADIVGSVSNIHLPSGYYDPWGPDYKDFFYAKINPNGAFVWQKHFEQATGEIWNPIPVQSTSNELFDETAINIVCDNSYLYFIGVAGDPYYDLGGWQALSGTFMLKLSLDGNYVSTVFDGLSNLPSGVIPAMDNSFYFFGSTGQDGIISRYGTNITGYISVISPSLGDSWYPGSTHNITWTDNISEDVYIQLQGTANNMITAQTPSTGTYSWTIPEQQPAGNYQIKIGSIYYDPIQAISSIFNIKAVIDIVFPNGGDTLQVLTPQTIQWTDNISENVKIDLLKSGAFYRSITTNTPSNGSYSWTPSSDLPNASDYQIKVTSVTSSSSYDVSSSYFTITSPFIEVLYPNGGESLIPGNDLSISWLDNIPGKVKIELLNGATLVSVVADSTESNGIYQWQIPYTIPAGSTYKIKITSIANASLSDSSDSVFSVIKKVLVTQPNGGITCYPEQELQIRWIDNFSDNVRIDLVQGTTVVHTITASIQSSGVFNWTIPYTVTNNTSYRIQISNVTTPAVLDQSDGDFTIGKKINALSPNGNEVLYPAEVHAITWLDNLSEDVVIELVLNDQATTVVVNSIPSNGSYNWTLGYDDVASTEYKIKLSSVSDSSIWDYSDGTFSIGKRIAIVHPNGGETWQTHTSQEITWMDNLPEQVMISLHKGTSFESEITESTDSNGLHLWDIPQSLAPSSDYSIQISSVLTPTVYANSQSLFTILGNIVVTSHSQPAVLLPGSIQNIQWEDNITENVKIELVRNGDLVSIITPSTLNQGHFYWEVPYSIEPNSGYRIKVTSVINPLISGTNEADLTVSGNLVVDFAADVTNGYVPLLVTFTAQATTNIISWSWDFDNDGIIDSNLETPHWEYQFPGTYTISLTVEHSSGIETVTKQDYVHTSINPTITRYVPSQYSTIQAAINASNNGDYVIVSA
ncbi:MAG: hypothetical protein LHW53_10455, partial [Candidatus Cloacimonetes bacterium]|nr:hypothetical protein [Candidatus Cloacimonadota bacterium]